MPYRLEIGPRDVAAGQGVLVRRVDREKETVAIGDLAAELPGLLAEYQQMLFQRATRVPRLRTPTRSTTTRVREVLDQQGGFLMAPWCGDGACEKQINAETGATIRVIPFDSPDEPGACIVDGRRSERRVLFARAY